MITAILIDDELPSLSVLEYYLGLTGEVNIVGKYNNSLKGIEAVGNLKPQAVFLDIDMPEVKGIEAASLISQNSPLTAVIFVTAYSEYAVQAYDISALDYLLKPVSIERLDKTINRIRAKTGLNIPSGKRRLKINCLGEFTVRWEDKEPIKWRSRKTREVMAFLIHNRDKTVSSEVITEAVWPGENPENSAHMLRNAIYYIRKAIKDYGVTDEEMSIQDRYCLTLGSADMDAHEFTQHYKRLSSDAELSQYTDCVGRYKGEYLAGSGWLWAEQERAGLSRIFLRLVSQASALASLQCDYMVAEEILLKGLSNEPYDEGIVCQLLDLYGQTGENVKAARLFKTYSEMVTSELGCSPSEEIMRKFNGR